MTRTARSRALAVALAAGFAVLGAATARPAAPAGHDAAGGEPGSAPADTAGGQTAAAGGSGLGKIVAKAQAAADTSGAPGDSTVAAADSVTGALWQTWIRNPSAHMTAGVRTVRWEASLLSEMELRDASKVNGTLNWSSEKYRQQNKIVEARQGGIEFRDKPERRRFKKEFDLNRTWTEDRTVNSTGSANVNRRDAKSVKVRLDSLIARIGPVRHSLRVEGQYGDSRQASLGTPNESREGNGSAGLLSQYTLAPGVTIVTTAYGEQARGKRTLGRQNRSSSSSGDSLSAFVGVERGALTTSFSVRADNFDRRYLDYRRNANGIVDTLGAVDKIVQELEQQDALAFDWASSLLWGRFSLNSTLNRDVTRESYQISDVGRRDNHQDHLRLWGSWTAARDTLSASYDYGWRWDDQTLQNATQARGKQISKNRELAADWGHRLFRTTGLKLRWQLRLDQQIAEGRFNENDTDRFENNVSARLGSDWAHRFQTYMIFFYRHVEDIAIRRSRSSNNNLKDTYEVVPGYFWTLADWFQLRQDYRISIQYTDYVFEGLPSVSARDDYNKRGNLNTKVTLRPTARLSVNLGHDYNVRFNAFKSASDAAGNTKYAREVAQRISTVSLGLTYTLQPGFTLEGATERTKDRKETYGARTTVQERFGGEVWVGGVYSRTWGGAQGGTTLSARLRKYYAYGPNVQAANADYWDADVSLGWKF